MSPEGANMKVFDGFASPRWSEAEPGVGCKKMQGPRRGPTKTFNLERRPHRVLFCAKRGLSSTGIISHERIKIENGIGIGHGFGVFAPFGDAVFFGGASVPRFPCTFGAAVTWGYSRCGPSGAGWRPTIFGDAVFLGGASVPRFPCTFGAAVTWGYSRCGPSGAA